MPVIVQEITSNARSTEVSIVKGTGSLSKVYKANPTPLPHQQDVIDHFASPAFKSPMWMLFRVGSGKSLCSLFCALKLAEMGIKRPIITIICDVSLLGQWQTVIKKLHTPPGFTFDILGVAQFEKRLNAKEIDLRRSHLVIVDEAQMFRNLSERMEKMINEIHKCPRVLLLSGTPIVNSGEDAVGFKYLCDPRAKTLAQAAQGRVAVYDPQHFAKFASLYPRKQEIKVHVDMSWPQTLVYFADMQNTFKLTLNGEKWSVSRPVNNRYNVALVSALNMPFEDAALSPKLCALVDTVKNAPKPVVVYSARIEKGIAPIKALLETGVPDLKVHCIDGSTPASARTDIIKKYNAGSVDVLIISPASARGIDLMKTGSFCVLEPHQNISEENQTIARAVRYKSHFGIEDACVNIYHFVCTFPKKAALTSAEAALLKSELLRIFGHECSYDAKHIIKALLPLIAAAKQTNDESQRDRNDKKHIEVMECMEIIEAASIPMPHTEASMQAATEAVAKAAAKAEAKAAKEARAAAKATAKAAAAKAGTSTSSTKPKPKTAVKSTAKAPTASKSKAKTQVQKRAKSEHK